MANKPSNSTEPAEREAISHTPKLTKRRTRKPKCWITEALYPQMACEEHSENFSTVVYTRGELQKPGPGPDGYVRGKIEVVPPEKSCIFDYRIADSECRFPKCFPEREAYFREKLISHHANSIQVYDRFKVLDYRGCLWKNAEVLLDGFNKSVSKALKDGDNESRDAAIEALPVVDFTEAVERTPLLSSRLLYNIPFSVDLLGGQNGPNAYAWTRRLTSDDPLLECEYIRHLMIRKGDKLLPSVAHQTFSYRVPSQQLADINHVAVKRYCHDRYALFGLEWSLLRNLESLCLDIRGIPEERSQPLEALFVKMGKHLRLKTLVLIGVPHLVDFNSVGNKEYVAQQEDDEFLVFPGDEHNPDTELTNYIHFLKECLRPGGELRLVVPNPQT